MPSIFIPGQPYDPRKDGFYQRRLTGRAYGNRRTINLKVAQGLSASGIPTAATSYPYLTAPVYLKDVDLFHVLLTAQSTLSGSPAGVQLVVQMAGDYTSAGAFVAMPGSPFALTLIGGATAPGSVVAAPLLVQNYGDLVAIGLQAASPWAGGTLQLSIKAKG
jgi:hypothetical protein